jgi:hypothetical protein
MRDCEIVIVLLTKNAWKRKHMDWELSTALRSTKSNPRKGVIVALMPNYGTELWMETNKTPLRIIKNVDNEYIEFSNWKNFFNVNIIKKLVNNALWNRENINPDDTARLRRKNKK